MGSTPTGQLVELAGKFVRHEPCPKCGSRDNVSRFSDNSAKCFGFGCNFWEPGDGKRIEKQYVTTKMIEGLDFRPLGSRKINEETCRLWGYAVVDNPPRQIATYHARDGSGPCAQKVRGKDKQFAWRGDASKVGLYGEHLWRDGGKMVVVTEGEVDALSVSQIQGNKWPVVSIPNGAGAAVEAVKNSINFLEKFDAVIFMFDNDEPGIAAAKDCAAVLTPGKAKIARLPLKDANDMLVAGRSKEVIDAIWGAKAFRPDGIVEAADLREKLRKEPERGLSYPWPSLTEYTYGIRLNELVALGAGTGIGKSDVFKEIIAHLLLEHKQKVGVLFLEEAVDHTVKCIMSKQAGKLFHIPGEKYTEAEFAAAEKAVLDTGRLFLYDHFGATDWEVVKSNIRYMAMTLGCKYIFLDHITALVSGDKDGDERKQLDYIMTDMASLVRQLNINIHFISHLTSPEGTPHEEGGRVLLKQFRGSRAIGQWTSFAIGLERDQQDTEADTTVRILKDRYTGRATGKTFPLRYGRQDGRMRECSTEFADESKNQEVSL